MARTLYANKSVYALIYRNSSDGTTPEAKEFRPSLKGQCTLKGEIQDRAFACRNPICLLRQTSQSSYVIIAKRGKIDVAVETKRSDELLGRESCSKKRPPRRCILDGSKIGVPVRAGFKVFTAAPSVSLVNACKRFLAKRVTL